VLFLILADRFATPPVKGVLQIWLFRWNFWGFKNKFATRIKNTSPLPRDFMFLT
jgi:hypothetical protein